MTYLSWARCLLMAFCFQGLAQADAPSQAELQYLSSVLPLIQARAWSDAEGKLLEGLKQFSRSAVLSNALGMVYEQENKNDDAIQAFEHATEWLPNFTAAQLHLASLLVETGACGRAEPLFLDVAKGTADPGALSATGIGLAQCKNYSSAVEVLKKAHALNLQSAATTFNLALAQFEHGEYQPALEALDSLPPGPEQQRPEALFLRGKLFQALKKPGSATSMSAACRARPEEDYCADAAIELIREEHFVEAADLLQDSIAAVPSSVAMLSTLGLAQFRLGRYRDAIASYSKALDLDPKPEASREGLGFLLYMTGDLERARSVVEQAPVKPNPDFYLSYLRALILYRLGRELWNESLTSLTEAMRGNPAFAPSYFLRGKIRMEQGNLGGALEDFQTATRLDTRYALPYYKIAQIYLRQGRPDEAKKARLQFATLGSLREEEVLTRQAQTQLLSSKIKSANGTNYKVR